MDSAPTETAFQTVDLSVQGLLLDIDRFASHDGPGIRTTVFLKGCPLSCVWCHSPESRHVQPELIYQDARCTGCALCIDECPQQALTMSGPGQGTDDGTVAVLNRALCQVCGQCVEVCYPGALKLAGRTVTVGEVVTQVEKDLPYFRSSDGGVTLSGGEPTRQADFAYHFLKACQTKGIHTALETTGYARWQTLASMAEVTDLFLYDIKFVDDTEHRHYTGVHNRVILENLQRLADNGSEIHVRVPCIPGINDSPQQIGDIARLVAETGLTQMVLLPYNGAAGAKYEWLDQEFDLAGVEPQSEETMNQLAAIGRDGGLDVQIGG